MKRKILKLISFLCFVGLIVIVYQVAFYSVRVDMDAEIICFAQETRFAQDNSLTFHEILYKKEEGGTHYLLIATENGDPWLFAFKASFLFPNRVRFSFGQSSTKGTISISRTSGPDTFYYVIYGDNRELQATGFEATIFGNTYRETGLGAYFIFPYTGKILNQYAPKSKSGFSATFYNSDGAVVDEKLY